MFDDLKTERQSARTSQSRLMAYVGALLVMGAAIAIAAGLASQDGGEMPEAMPEPDVSLFEASRAPIDLAKLPGDDTSGVHAKYDFDALRYLFEIADHDYSPVAVRLPLAELAALPFGSARGKVYETVGTVEAIERETWRSDEGRLWSVVLRDEGGGRVIVLKFGLASDAHEGRPEDSITTSTEYVKEGQRLLVRGIYLQRRTGTVGQAMLRDPVPVLVATPPPTAFRRLPEPAVSIADPTEADWDDVKDRNLRETKNLEEPALFQMIQWARERGREAMLEDLRTGTLRVEPWDDDLFEHWGKEIEIAEPDVPRPITESLRGRLFSTPGYIGNFQRESWGSVHRSASAWGVDTMYVLDLVGDYWAHQGIRCVSVWPIEAYTGVTGDREQHVRITGFFLKNHTYSTQKRVAEVGGRAIVTMPLFLVIDVDPLPDYVSSYGVMIWFVSGGLLVFFLLFYFVFVRGERKEAASMEQRRRELRKRRRQQMLDEPAGDPDPAEDGTGS